MIEETPVIDTQEVLNTEKTDINAPLIKPTPVNKVDKKDKNQEVFGELLKTAKEQATEVEPQKDELPQEKKTTEKTVRIPGANSKPLINPNSINNGYSNKPSSSVFGPKNRKTNTKKTNNKQTQKTKSDMDTLLETVNKNKKANDTSDVTEDMY